MRQREALAREGGQREENDARAANFRNFQDMLGFQTRLLEQKSVLGQVQRQEPTLLSTTRFKRGFKAWGRN